MPNVRVPGPVYRELEAIKAEKTEALERTFTLQEVVEALVDFWNRHPELRSA